jgi:hypothetical protein
MNRACFISCFPNYAEQHADKSSARALPLKLLNAKRPD